MKQKHRSDFVSGSWHDWLCQTTQNKASGAQATSGCNAHASCFPVIWASQVACLTGALSPGGTCQLGTCQLPKDFQELLLLLVLRVFCLPQNSNHFSAPLWIKQSASCPTCTISNPYRYTVYPILYMKKQEALRGDMLCRRLLSRGTGSWGSLSDRWLLSPSSSSSLIFTHSFY